MNEDERYRTSTQFKLWSYTPESLAAQRASTNKLAAERVKAAVHRLRAAKAAEANIEGEQNATESRPAGVAPEAEINCLAPEEELKLMAFYLKNILDLADFLTLPTEVKVQRQLNPVSVLQLTISTGHGCAIL